MSAYYNEFDPFAAQWLRNLIAEGLIAPGDVDERSITEVEPDDLEGYTQCHFFAGIGGWSYALRLAGWPDHRPVWTGSCPCQPFSAAGKQGGGDDERHLWPAWFRLARECRPDIILGEQVEGAVGFGWLDRVFADLEDEDYACGATVLGAHSVGAPHIRQRLWWVADADNTQRREVSITRQDGRDRTDGGREETHSELGTYGEVRGLGNADDTGPQGRDIGGNCTDKRAPWTASLAHQCSDGKIRRVPATDGQIKPALFPLADGISNRVGLLRGSGNAINPFAAAEFITAYMEAT